MTAGLDELIGRLLQTVAYNFLSELVTGVIGRVATAGPIPLNTLRIVARKKREP